MERYTVEVVQTTRTFIEVEVLAGCEEDALDMAQDAANGIATVGAEVVGETSEFLGTDDVRILAVHGPGGAGRHAELVSRYSSHLIVSRWADGSARMVMYGLDEGAGRWLESAEHAEGEVR